MYQFLGNHFGEFWGGIGSFIEPIHYKFNSNNIWVFGVLLPRMSRRSTNWGGKIRRQPVGCWEPASHLRGPRNNHALCCPRWYMCLDWMFFWFSTGHQLEGPVLSPGKLLPSPFSIVSSYQPVVLVKTKKVKSHCSCIGPLVIVFCLWGYWGLYPKEQPYSYRHVLFVNISK